MPHVVVKMHAGKTDDQKKLLADAITKAFVSSLNYSEAVVSVAIEDVLPDRWAEDVYKPDILGNKDKLYKEPGYNPFK